MTRTMVGGLLVLAFVASVSPDAAADRRYYDSVYASPIYRTSFYSYTSGVYKEFETTDLKGGLFGWEDTFMVITAPNGTEYYNDNCSSGTKSSCRLIYAPTTGVWTVTVFATWSWGYGTADVRVRDVSLTSGAGPWWQFANNASFGGTIINLSLPDGETFAYQTAHRPQGSDDTELLVYSSTWQEKGYDNNGGIEDAARVVATKASGDRVVIGAWSSASSGYTSFVANECLYQPDEAAPLNTQCWSAGHDQDRDGLSDALEVELLTDATQHDTDSDGLFDYFEVLGHRGGDGTEQQIKPLGANPRRRDLFVEIDRAAGTAPHTVQAVELVRDVYAELELANPDGSSGFTVHMDIGLPCADSTLCGDWGGVDDDLTLSGSSGISYGNVSNNMSMARHGLFKYGYVSGAGTGQAKRPGTSFYVGNASACLTYHELGHTFGMEHWGDPTQPLESRMNQKSAYPSTMNYNYDCTMPGNGLSRSSFSRGLMSAIIHTAFDESSYSPGADKSYLSGTPFLYLVTGDAVDFNYDGRTGTPEGGRVAHDPAPMNREYIRGGWPDLFATRPIGGAVPSGGGALAVVPDPSSPDGYAADVWTFAPFSHPDGTYPDFMKLSDEAETNPPQPWPTAWSTGKPLAGLPDGEVAAIAHEFAAGMRIVVVFPNEQGQLVYRLVDPAAPSTAAWMPISGWPAGTTARNASVAIVDGDVTIVWRDTSSELASSSVYASRINASGVASIPALQTGVVSEWTPAIATASDGNIYMAVLFPGIFGGAPAVGILRRNAGSLNAWSDAGFGSSVAKTDDPQDVVQRLNLLFLPYRDDAGEPFSDGTGYLAAFWNAGNFDDAQGEWRAVRAYSSGYIGPVGNANVWMQAPRWQEFIDRPYVGHSATAVRRWHDAVVAYTSSNWGPKTAAQPTYVPFASGVAFGSQGLNTDFNDVAQIGASACSSLWRLVHGNEAACYCLSLGAPTPTCAPGPSAEVVTCDGLSME